MIQLRDVDLNLLVVLDALLTEQSVTRAADQLHLTPSAVSHALKRLRELFDDELLVRDGRRMRPTARAEVLAESLPRLLRQVSRTIERPEPFRAATSSRIFRLVAPDFVAPLVPTLLRAIHGEAPNVRVELAPYSTSAVRDLVDGRNDALIGSDSLRSDGLRAAPLGTWPWAVYGRAGHPAFDDWTVAAWSAHPHLQVRPPVFEGRGPTDLRAAELGIKRVVHAVVPHFSMAAPVLAKTDLLLSVPSVAMGDTADAYDLDVRDLPFELAPLKLSLFRNAAEGDEPGREDLGEAGFGDVGPDQHQLSVGRQRNVGVGVSPDRAVCLDRHDVALRAPVDVRVGQRRPGELARDGRAEHVEPVGDEQRLVAAEVVPDRRRPCAGVRQHGVGAGAIQRRHVAVQPRTGHDPRVGPQPAAVAGQVHVDVVVVGGDQHRAGFADPGLLEHRAVGGVADHVPDALAAAARPTARRSRTRCLRRRTRARPPGRRARRR